MVISQNIVDAFQIVVAGFASSFLLALLFVGLTRYLRVRWYDRDITR